MDFGDLLDLIVIIIDLISEICLYIISKKKDNFYIIYIGTVVVLIVLIIVIFLKVKGIGV